MSTHPAGDRIFLRGIAVFGRHGVLPEEARLGQRFEIDLDCFLDLSEAGSSDDLRHSVNYAEVHGRVREIGESERYALIEALAGRIAKVLLAEFPISSVRVEVRKPGAPIAGLFDTVGVEIFRHRPE